MKPYDTEPPRSADEIAREWCSLLPPGSAFAGPNIRTLIEALAQPRERLEGDIVSLISEFCPGTSRQLLGDYRDVLGPDPLERDAGIMSDDDWRDLLQARWTQRGDQRPAFYKNLAHQLGCEIDIWEPGVPEVGPTICGGSDQVTERPTIFCWIVKVSTGASPAVIAKMRKFFNLLKPADTEVYFLQGQDWLND